MSAYTDMAASGVSKSVVALHITTKNGTEYRWAEVDFIDSDGVSWEGRITSPGTLSRESKRGVPIPGRYTCVVANNDGALDALLEVDDPLTGLAEANTVVYRGFVDLSPADWVKRLTATYVRVEEDMDNGTVSLDFTSQPGQKFGSIRPPTVKDIMEDLNANNSIRYSLRPIGDHENDTVPIVMGVWEGEDPDRLDMFEVEAQVVQGYGLDAEYFAVVAITPYQFHIEEASDLVIARKPRRVHNMDRAVDLQNLEGQVLLQRIERSDRHDKHRVNVRTKEWGRDDPLNPHPYHAIKNIINNYSDVFNQFGVLADEASFRNFMLLTKEGSIRVCIEREVDTLDWMASIADGCDFDLAFNKDGVLYIPSVDAMANGASPPVALTLDHDKEEIFGITWTHHKTGERWGVVNTVDYELEYPRLAETKMSGRYTNSFSISEWGKRFVVPLTFKGFATPGDAETFAQRRCARGETVRRIYRIHAPLVASGLDLGDIVQITHPRIFSGTTRWCMLWGQEDDTGGDIVTLELVDVTDFVTNPYLFGVESTYVATSGTQLGHGLTVYAGALEVFADGPYALWPGLIYPGDILVVRVFQSDTVWGDTENVFSSIIEEPGDGSSTYPMVLTGDGSIPQFNETIPASDWFVVRSKDTEGMGGVGSDRFTDFGRKWSK